MLAFFMNKTDSKKYHCSLLTAHCSLLTAHRLLPTAHCLLISAFGAMKTSRDWTL
jgi:hypothetical protein